MQYKVVYGTGSMMTFAIEDLQKEVQEHLKKGWKPLGGVSITYTGYICAAAQAMTK